MSSSDPGNPASYPATIQIPDDSDPWDASSYAPGLSELADRTANLHALALEFGIQQVFNANGTKIVPPGCDWMMAVMSGGGGGGERGNRGENVFGSGTLAYVQGGGGAGAPLVVYVFPTTPGNQIDITVGAGGPGGTTSAGAGAGADGAFSAIQDDSTGQYLAVAPGAAGCGQGDENWSGGLGVGAVITPTLPGNFAQSAGVVAPGAVGLAMGASFPRPFPFSTGPLPLQINSTSILDVGRFVPSHPQRGGSVILTFQASAFPARVSTPGVGCLNSGSGLVLLGGAPGTQGSDSAGAYGGMGGGGGGAGAFGSGAIGGNGGNGNAGGTGADGTAGAAAAANSGAGGGGGGGGGWGNTTPGNGKAGGHGGSGKVILYWLQQP
jgi:hypothetical protein